MLYAFFLKFINLLSAFKTFIYIIVSFLKLYVHRLILKYIEAKCAYSNVG